MQIENNTFALSKKIDQYKEEIHNRNCQNFVSVSIGGTIITGAIFLIGIYLKHYTRFMVEYSFFFIYFCLMYLLAVYCKRNQVKAIVAVYYLAMLPVFSAGILMGTFLDTTQPAFTVMMLICVLTLFIIDKPLRIFVYLLGIATLFAVCSYYSKSEALFIKDMINLVIYSLVALGTNYFNLKDRVESAQNYCEAREKSERDILTGLLNRGTGEIQVRNQIKNQVYGAFIIIDIDNFKQVNDSYGHQVGDEVICLVAKALQQVFRSNDIVFRLGGDEFAVFVPGLIQKPWCEKKFLQLNDCLLNSKLLMKKEITIKIGISIGCTIYRLGKVDFESLYKSSDKALYQAKEERKGKFIIVDY